MGGYPRYCVQCGSGLTPSTRFCGHCGQATTPAAAETGLPDQPAANPRELESPAAAAQARPGGPPPGAPAAAPAGPWRDARSSSATTPDLAARPDLDPTPDLATRPGFAAPPTGPAYPPPPPPAGRPVPPPPDRPGRPATDRAGSGPRPTYLPAQDRTGSGPRPAYPPPPAQDRTGSGPRPAYPPPPAPYALPSTSSAPPPPPAATTGPAEETAKLGTSWTDQVGFRPQWEQAPAGSQWPSSPPARTAMVASPAAWTAEGQPQPRKRQLLSVGLFVLIAAVLVVPALLIVHALHGLGGTSAAAAEPTSKPSRPASAPATERSAATALAGLLAQSVTDRDTIVSAVGAVNHCSSAVNQAPAQFQEGATSRQKLLKQLASMPGRSELPAAMLRELTTAWQASATVDTDLSKWAQDEVSTGCHAHNDANLAASDGPDAQASSAKSAFVSMWNPIAARYGLTRYSTGQL